MSSIKARPPQTKVKHTILENYLNSWGGIIINGLRHTTHTFHFIYVDCNASNGRFTQELEDMFSSKEEQTVWGSPIIGVQTLDKHAAWAREKASIHVRTTSILLEKDGKTFEELKRSLQLAGMEHRVKETDDFFSLQDGQIAILHKDSTTMAPHLVRYTQSGSEKFSFFVLDPYGPKGIPLQFVHEIIRQPRHDVLIYMPYLDLHKKSGLVPKANRTSIDEKLLMNYNLMFGGEQWQNIIRDLDSDEMQAGQASLHMEIMQTEAAEKAGNLELDLVNLYKKALSSVDPSLVVKSIDLHFPDKERTMYYLYLTTHDANGALYGGTNCQDSFQPKLR